MDSQWDFPLAKSIYGQQYFDGFIPELIIVGITWGGVRPNADSLRARDYIPAGDKKVLQGANRFLLFMKAELFPFVEKSYAADPNNRTMMGCSLGGLITLYALFTHTEMFNGYIAASPAIGWNNEGIYKFEQEYFRAKLTKPVKLYVTIGGVETNVAGFENLSDFLSKRKYHSLQLKTKCLKIQAIPAQKVKRIPGAFNIFLKDL
jgi:predicted alpha/beta superfamily hydrolase